MNPLPWNFSNFGNACDRYIFRSENGSTSTILHGWRQNKERKRTIINQSMKSKWQPFGDQYIIYYCSWTILLSLCLTKSIILISQNRSTTTTKRISLNESAVWILKRYCVRFRVKSYVFHMSIEKVVIKHAIWNATIATYCLQVKWWLFPWNGDFQANGKPIDGVLESLLVLTFSY